MSSRNEARRDPLYLGRVLKNWLVQQSPPSGGKARLMRAVSLKTPTARSVRSVRVEIALFVSRAFSRAWGTLFLPSSNRNGLSYFPAELGDVLSEYSNLSLQLARHAVLQSHPTGTGIFCLIS